MPWTPNAYDEGIIATGAAQVAMGWIPHRDFYFNYGPAQLYALAGFYKLFEASFLAERLWDALIRGGITVLVFLILRRHLPAKAALAVAFSVLTWIVAIGFPGYPIFSSLVMTFLAVLLLQPALAQPGAGAVRGRLIGAGAALGAVALVRYDVGFYASVACVAVLFVATVAARLSWIDRVRAVAWLGVGIAAPALPCAALYVAIGVLPGFYHDIFAYPVHDYQAMRGLPFPRLRPLSAATMAIYLPVLIWGATSWALLRDWRHRSVRCDVWTVWLLLCLSVMFYLKGLVRVSEVHMALSIIAGIVMLPLLAGRGCRECLRNPPLILAIAVALSLLGLHAAGVVGVFRHNAAALGNQACQAVPDLPAARCADVSAQERDALLYIVRHTQPHEPIFVGTGRHDKLFVNNVMFYFLAGRTPATRWYHFDPGLQTRADIQASMIAALQAGNTRFIVLDRSWDAVREPNASALSSGQTALDAFIAANYHPVAEYGPYLILEAGASGSDQRAL